MEFLTNPFVANGRLRIPGDILQCAKQESEIILCSAGRGEGKSPALIMPHFLEEHDISELLHGLICAIALCEHVARPLNRTLHISLSSCNDIQCGVHTVAFRG